MLEATFRIPNEPALIKEFRSVRGVLSASGNERIEVPRTGLGHGDRVSAICLAGSIALQYGAGEPERPKVEMNSDEWREGAKAGRARGGSTKKRGRAPPCRSCRRRVRSAARQPLCFAPGCRTKRLFGAPVATEARTCGWWFRTPQNDQNHHRLSRLKYPESFGF